MRIENRTSDLKVHKKLELLEKIIFGWKLLVETWPDTWNLFVPWPDAWAWCLGLMPGPDARAWFLGLMPRPNAWAWFLTLMPRPDAWAWCLGLVPWPGTLAWYLGLMPGQAYTHPSLVHWAVEQYQMNHASQIFGGVLMSLTTKGQCYKAFYGRNLQIFVISWSVCPWQAFPALPNVCG